MSAVDEIFRKSKNREGAVAPILAVKRLRFTEVAYEQNTTKHVSFSQIQMCKTPSKGWIF